MNESDMMLQEEIRANLIEDGMEAQQSMDEERFKWTIEQILLKIRRGEATIDDEFELRSCLRFYNIDV